MSSLKTDIKKSINEQVKRLNLLLRVAAQIGVDVKIVNHLSEKNQLIEIEFPDSKYVQK